MKSLSINVPLVEAFDQMPGYAKFMKNLVTKKRSMNFETIKVTHQVSAIVHSMAPKLEDPEAFMIPCTIGSVEFDKDLCDLGQGRLFVMLEPENLHSGFMDLVNGVIVDETSATINVEKELIATVFAIKKFWPYLIGAKVIVHADHVALCYLMSKKDSKLV
ncbi:PREDICTED: uncharacterized protein LOC109232678 [Nicotiana attenuata]|uniref:uncharacterized protein LOC109232678 n=1 Tax=Nicotiana attenuata TaxID=49451 RepID=UPI0009051660|nr:PREDICTED: uncharacterized protein LOC109232678 [Nicotiana attenuata]